jgi:hypothetical protein
MAKTPINEQFIKMQKLAGVITESQYTNRINEMNIEDDLELERKWKALDNQEKLDIIEPYADGGEADSFLNLGIGEMPSGMSDAIKDYFAMDYTPNPNNFTDDYEIERDKSPFGDDAMFESKKTKMTKTELKEAIRQEILAALTEDNLTEAEDEEEEEIALDAETEETPADDTEAESGDAVGDTTDSQDVQKELTDALEAAKKLGDKKLVRQIGNALTYFTRQQISSEEEM